MGRDLALHTCPACMAVVPCGDVDSLDSLRDEIIEWQRATFPTSTPASKLAHLRREIAELAKNPIDENELADVFFLWCALTADFDEQRGTVHIAEAIRSKLDENRSRKWSQPDAEGVVEHIRENPAPVRLASEGHAPCCGEYVEDVFSHQRSCPERSRS